VVRVVMTTWHCDRDGVVRLCVEVRAHSDDDSGRYAHQGDCGAD